MATVRKSRATKSAQATDATVKSEQLFKDADPVEAGFWRTWYDQAIKATVPDDFKSNWKRILVAFVVSMAVSMGVGYLGGYVLGHILVGAMVLGTNMFAFSIMYVIGLLAGIYYGSKSASYVYRAIIDKSADKLIVGAYDKVTGWFQPVPKGATA